MESSEANVSATSTHFGFQSVPEHEKTQHVARVFDSVAARYDLMNDLMSGGMHRLWKSFTLSKASPRAGQRVLDVASGTGDLAKAFAKRVGPKGTVIMTDINETMLGRGRDRLLDSGVVLPTTVCDAEALPFSSNQFDLVAVAFGLRNMTHKDRALSEMLRVLRPGGKLLVLEFSQVDPFLAPAYDWYSFNVLPKLGRWVVDDAESYRYLAESIRMHPGAESLAEMMREVGFERVSFDRLTAGVVALHQGIKF